VAGRVSRSGRPGRGNRQAGRNGESRIALTGRRSSDIVS
jgi:hypothetical protein